jgi:hypothetical protein
MHLAIILKLPDGAHPIATLTAIENLIFQLLARVLSITGLCLWLLEL